MLLERRARWEADQLFLDGFAAQPALVSTHLDAAGYAEWPAAIDALGIAAIVYPSKAGGDRYQLTTRFEGTLTTELIRDLASTSAISA